MKKKSKKGFSQNDKDKLSQAEAEKGERTEARSDKDDSAESGKGTAGAFDSGDSESRNEKSRGSGSKDSGSRGSRGDRGEHRYAAFMSGGRLSFVGYIAVVAFGILFFWALNHFPMIANGVGTVVGFFSPLIAGLAIAFVINAVLVPIEGLWEKIFRKGTRASSLLKRPVCLVLSTIIAVGVVTAIIFMLVPELKSTAHTFADKLPAFLSRLEGWITSLTTFLTELGFSFEEISLDSSKILDKLEVFIENEGKNVFDTTLGITTSIFSSVFNIILAVVFAFYVLAGKEKIGKRLRTVLYALAPEKIADRTVSTLSLANVTFSKFLTGQLTEAVIIGVLCFIGMLILRLPYAAVISVLIGATALIPMFGAFIGTALGAVLILSESLPKAIWFIVFIIILQQLESNLIYPRVVGKSLGLPGILVLASITVGGAMFGFVGILIGVPVCSVLYCLFNEFIDKRVAEKEKNEEKPE